MTPYGTAPYHQQIIYSPTASVAGDRTVKGQDCMAVGEPGLSSILLTTPSESIPAPPAPTFYAFVNECGPRYAVTSELARELPSTPQQSVGLPADHRSGPQIILWAEGLGPDPRATSVSLTTASGVPVPGVRIASGDRDAILVPPVLRAGVSYRLQVQWVGEEVQLPPEGGPPVISPGPTATQSLSFATQPARKHRARHRRRSRHHR
jgi:hypothetical protein